jgi:predicted NUDIX family NTP pyrophosphohydrolase
MQRSAGILPFRRRDGVEVLVAHPGGPFWASKEEGAWSIVKGLVEAGEDDVTAATREFEEETGWRLDGELVPLGEIRQKSGKTVAAWAVETDADPETLAPGTFTMDWHGQARSFPEIDRVAWVDPDTARRLLNPAQAPLVDRLLARLAGGG